MLMLNWWFTYSDQKLKLINYQTDFLTLRSNCVIWSIISYYWLLLDPPQMLASSVPHEIASPTEALLLKLWHCMRTHMLTVQIQCKTMNWLSLEVSRW